MKWISRAEWGARPAREAAYTVAPSVRTAFLSHYDGGADIVLPDHDACFRQVRKVQAFHMDGNGWSDIGYNTLGCPHGYVFEGRGLDKVGAHCPDFNRVGHGHQFMLGGDQEPTDAALAAAREVYDLQVKRSGNTLRKMGHRDGFATECPGKNVYEWVKAGMPVTATATPALTEEDDLSAAADEIKDYIGKILVGGYTDGGKPFPGMAKVDIETQRRVTALAAQVSALSAAVKALAESKGADSAALIKAVTTATEKALSGLEITLKTGE